MSAAFSHAVSVSSEKARSPVSAERVADAVRLTLRSERARHALVSVAFVSATKIARLNREHLGHAGATDVISFAFIDPSGATVGDIYICPEVAARNARQFRVGVREELLRLVVHGTLHVVGHDHPEGEERLVSSMWKRQEQLLKRILKK